MSWIKNIFNSHLPSTALWMATFLLAPVPGVIMKDKKSIIIGAAIALTLLVWAGAFLLVKSIQAEKKEITSKSKEITPQVSPEVFSAQLKELQRVTDFFNGKDEYALRQAFDFEGYIKFSLIRAKQVIAPDKLSPAQSDAMEKFFQGWLRAIFDTRYLPITKMPSGTPQVEVIPGVVGILRLPAKYTTTEQMLRSFESSPHIPTKIQEAIKDFDSTAGSNALLLIEVINERLAQDKDNIVLEDVQGARFFGGTMTAYWNRFTPLKPKADIVLQQIRTFLNVR